MRLLHSAPSSRANRAVIQRLRSRAAGRATQPRPVAVRRTATRPRRTGTSTAHGVGYRVGLRSPGRIHNRQRRKRMNGMLIRAMIVSVFVAAVVALGTPAQASFRPASAHATHRAALVKTIKVTAKDFKFILSAKTAKRGIVIFKVTNLGATAHDFSIKGRTTRQISHGQSATLRVTFLRKGHYPYKCTVDSHASLGMKGVFTIT